MDKNKILNLRNKYIGDSCTLFYPNDPLLILKGKGTYLYDEDGNEYLDCINNVAAVGHCHPKVVEATHVQNQLLETNSRYLHPHVVELAHKLSQLLPDPLSKCYFLNSGSEATDLALNLAFYVTGGTEVIVLDHAYHGHLVSAMSISPYKFNQGKRLLGKKDWVHVAPCPDIYRGIYNPDTVAKFAEETQPLNGFSTKFSNSGGEFDFGAAYAFEVVKLIRSIQKSGRKLAAFFAESMVSCGGQIILPPGFLKRVYSEVRKAGGICVADEIQTGFARTGTHWWAFQLQDVVPDIVTLGKPMGNGHPVAALVTTPEISAKYAENGIQYFNTFGGNPVSCAAALAVIEVIESEALMENARTVGSHLLDLLRKVRQEYPSVVGDVRGIGLFIGIELIEPIDCCKNPNPELAKAIVEKMRASQIIVSREGPDENILKIKPPLCFSLKDADRLAECLKECLAQLVSNRNS